jgi:hypothetical protein
MGEKRFICLVGKYEGKRLLGRPRCRWEVSEKLDVKVWLRIGDEWRSRFGFHKMQRI